MSAPVKFTRSRSTEKVGFATPENTEVGDVLVERLWTDDLAFLVTGVTPTGVWLSMLRDKEGVPAIPDEHCDKGAHGLRVVWYLVETEVDSFEESRLRRFDSDGLLRYRRSSTASYLRHARRIDGQPVRRFDQRF